MKTKHLLLVIIIGFAGMINPEARAQVNEFQLIKHETELRQDLSTALHFFENKEAVIRFREVDLSENIKSLFAVEPEDRIVLNLFSDVEYIAEVRWVEEIMEDNVTITAGILSLDYAHAIISTTEGRTLAVIRIPGTGLDYQITSDPITKVHYLIEINRSLLERPVLYPPVITDEPPDENTEEDNFIEKHDESRSTGPWDPATIDVMVVYTPAARTWGNTNGGGIKNLIAIAMATSQVVLTNSNTVVTMRLVYNSEVSYTESGSAQTDLNRLRYTDDGYMDIVHTWRNTYGADLVQLYTTLNGGIGNLITDINGEPARAFSISGVSWASDYVPIHEMGHNMGCHHHKLQTHQPGPTIWSNWPGNNWSAGWRWTGNDAGRYCSVMTYPQGNVFPDGVDHDWVPYFSNPSVFYQGVAAGHSSNGDNARTIRGIKHAIAGYRSTSTISCLSCPGYNWHIYPASSWQTTSSSIGYNGCKVYRFNAVAGRTYVFQTGCGNGATATFDTFLQLLNSDCNIVAVNDDGCENFRSKIEWVATYDGYAYLVVRGYSAAHYGSYTLAYQRPLGCNSNTQFPSATLNPESNWKYQNNIYPGEFSRFNVTSGTTYHWSLCNYHGGNATYDSQLTLRHGTTNSLIAYSDDECGTGLDAFISWTANFTGTVKVVVSKFNCQGESTPTRLAYKSGTLTNPYVNITPTNRNVLNTAGSVTYSITSNTAWTLNKNVTWITSLSQTSGSGNATINVNYNANTGAQRVGTLTAAAHGISDVTATLTQMPGNDAYCNSVAQWGGPLTPANDWQYHAGILAGEFVTFNVTNGTQYHFSLCPEHGGSASYDSELTLRRADNNVALAYSNDACGNDARISWTANFTGLVKLVLTRHPCESQNTGTRIAYKSGALTSIAVSLSPENRDVLSGAGTVYYSLQSNTTWSISKDAAWITSVTPSSGTGNATIAVVYTANSGSQRIGTLTASSGTFSTQATLTQMPFSAYCNSVNQWGGLLEPEDTWKYLHNMWAGEYARFTVVSGTQYHWSLCPEHGGNASYDSRLTLRNAATNSYITHNSSFCGDDGKITWTANFTGEVKVIVTKNPCDSYTSSTRLAYKKGTLANPSITLSPIIRVLGPLGGSVTYNVTSNTTWTLSSDAVWAVLSQTSGSGNATITVNYSANTGSDRTATFTGVANYGPTVTASLSQYDYCGTGSQYLTRDATDTWQYINCIYAGEYATFPVVEGEKYNWSLCALHGAAVSYEAQLTLRKSSDNSFIAYAYNNCGPDDNGAFIDWIADFTGNVRVYVNKFNCQPENICTRLGYKKGNLDAPFIHATPAERVVSHVAGATTFELLSNTTNWTVVESIPWLSVTPINATGNETITVNYEENPSAIPRSGEITISAPYAPEVVVIVNQNGAPPYLTVAPLERNVSEAEGTTTFSISSNTEWNVSEALSWLNVVPMSGTLDGIITVSYNENTDVSPRSGEITISAFETPDIIVYVNQDGASVPENITIPPMNVIPGEYLCFNATQTITVEGLTIQSGGVVNLIAGQNIIMLPGTHAHSGSNLHAWISLVDHCGVIAAPALVASPTEIIPIEQEIRTPTKEVFFKIYPNPTAGDFTIEMQGFEESEPVLIQIFTMQGTMITNQQMPGAKEYTFSLAGRQTGMYLVRVMQTDKTGVVKIMKK